LAINLLQPQFGYNFQGLSPFEPEVVGSGVVANQVPRTVTALHSSSGFVMLASKFAISAVDKSSWWTAGGGNPVLGTGLWGHDLSGSLTPYTDNGPMSTTIVGAPDCGDVPDVCADSWGMEDPSNPYDAAYNSQFPPGQPGIVEGVNTGGVSRRREDEMTMVFCDTHAKALRPGYAAIGTTYSDYTLRANTHVTDKTQYMWEDF
jgi:hypothetical protein